MKKVLGICWIVLCMLVAVSCNTHTSVQPQDGFAAENPIGNHANIAGDVDTVIAVGASLADMWTLAGGRLAATTSDAAEQGIEIGDAQIIGTMRDPNVEKMMELEPGLVLLSADIATHREAAAVLEQAGIPCFMAKNDSLDDYVNLLDVFTSATGKKELLQTYGDEVKDRVQAVLDRVPADAEKTVLFLRASSTEVKAKYADNATCTMLDELGTANIAANDSSLLENLSLEAIVEKDPDHIFVVTMGSDSQKAEHVLEASLMANPAWQTLRAVQNGNFEILPQELFHYKPNARWGEAYEYLYQRIYG